MDNMDQNNALNINFRLEVLNNVIIKTLMECTHNNQNPDVVNKLNQVAYRLEEKMFSKARTKDEYLAGIHHRLNFAQSNLFDAPEELLTGIYPSALSLAQGKRARGTKRATTSLYSQNFGGVKCKPQSQYASINAPSAYAPSLNGEWKYIVEQFKRIRMTYLPQLLKLQNRAQEQCSQEQLLNGKQDETGDQAKLVIQQMIQFLYLQESELRSIPKKTVYECLDKIRLYFYSLRKKNISDGQIGTNNNIQKYPSVKRSLLKDQSLPSLRMNHQYVKQVNTHNHNNLVHQDRPSENRRLTYVDRNQNPKLSQSSFSDEQMEIIWKSIQPNSLLNHQTSKVPYVTDDQVEFISQDVVWSSMNNNDGDKLPEYAINNGLESAKNKDLVQENSSINKYTPYGKMKRHIHSMGRNMSHHASCSKKPRNEVEL